MEVSLFAYLVSTKRKFRYRRPRKALLGILGGAVPPLLQILTLFQIKNVIFHTRFQTRQTSKIHNCFQTWPLERNYVTLN